MMFLYHANSRILNREVGHNLWHDKKSTQLHFTSTTYSLHPRDQHFFDQYILEIKMHRWIYNKLESLIMIIVYNDLIDVPSDHFHSQEKIYESVKHKCLYFAGPSKIYFSILKIFIESCDKNNIQCNGN